MEAVGIRMAHMSKLTTGKNNYFEGTPPLYYVPAGIKEAFSIGKLLKAGY
jgi:hypothetical protein